MVMIDDRQPPHASRCQILDRWTADPASAHHQDMRGQQCFLSSAAHFAQHDVAGVAVQWIVGEAGHAIRRSDPGGAEAAVTALVTLARDITAAPTMAPISIDFVNPAPADRSPHEAILGCPVAFDSTSTRVRIPVQWLAMPLRHPDPQLLALLRAQAA